MLLLFDFHVLEEYASSPEYSSDKKFAPEKILGRNLMQYLKKKICYSSRHLAEKLDT